MNPGLILVIAVLGFGAWTVIAWNVGYQCGRQDKIPDNATSFFHDNRYEYICSGKDAHKNHVKRDRRTHHENNQGGE
jgi:hypothetical protein